MLELLHPESIKPLCNVETLRDREAFSIPGYDGGLTQELLERASIVACWPVTPSSWGPS